MTEDEERAAREAVERLFSGLGVAMGEDDLKNAKAKHDRLHAISDRAHASFGVAFNAFLESGAKLKSNPREVVQAVEPLMAYLYVMICILAMTKTPGNARVFTAQALQGLVDSAFSALDMQISTLNEEVERRAKGTK